MLNRKSSIEKKRESLKGISVRLLQFNFIPFIYREKDKTVTSMSEFELYDFVNNSSYILRIFVK